MRIFGFSLLIGMSLLLSGCSFLFMKSYGMKKPKPMNNTEILSLADRYHIPPEDCYKLDTTSYISYLKSLDQELYKQEIKNHYQPLQALYYSPDGGLDAFLINCYTGGFPNLDWERDNSFETFPPDAGIPADSLFPLAKQLEFLIPLAKSSDWETRNYDKIVLVHWNRFMGRQSKRLIALVQDNLKQVQGQKIKLLYVNTDDFFLDLSE